MTGNGLREMQREQFGSPLEKISLEEAEKWILFGLDNNWYTQIAWCANGLGPKHMFNFYKLRLKADDYTPADEWEISKEDYEYLKVQYKDSIGIY